MNKEEALLFQKHIEDLCERNNVFCVSSHEKKPDLKGIRLEVSIKIEPAPSIKFKREIDGTDKAYLETVNIVTDW